MGFTGKCWMKGKSESLIKELSKIGCKICSCVKIKDENCVLFCIDGNVHILQGEELAAHYHEVSRGECKLVECDSEQVFLAIAALQDDKDKCQSNI